MRFLCVLILLGAFLPLSVFAEEIVLAKCKATGIVCARHEENYGIYIYHASEPKNTKELRLQGLPGMNSESAEFYFTTDGKFLAVNGGTGSAGRDFTIYRHLKGLNFKCVREDAVTVAMEHLAFPNYSDGPVLDHCRSEFAGWAGPHVMRVKLFGRGSGYGVGGWEALFDLDTLKLRASPTAKNEGKIMKGKPEDER